MEYTLSKEPKGKKFLYTVKDGNGNIKAKRISARNYVACTVDGEFFFGRKDLIGKGDHGRILSEAYKILEQPQEAYKAREQSFIPSYRKQWEKENPYEEWIKRNEEWAKDVVERYGTVVILQD